MNPTTARSAAAALLLILLTACGGGGDPIDRDPDYVGPVTEDYPAPPADVAADQRRGVMPVVCRAHPEQCV